jgi:hypothetical protein
MKVAIDVPEKLIEIAKQCDFSVIPPNLHDTKLRELAQLASQWIPRKSKIDLTNMQYRSIDLGQCPPKLVNLINQMDFNKVSKPMQMMAIPFIKGYLQREKIMN